ncbi:hypothetical protein [Methylophilus aquaticus]|uniref:VWA domain-containing protein n=1 Tax=Methylophilus aquaticus TaxID=1971610 RepID=A0ABT9JVP8_9PROT|nr:hypothetical protein [Methylophilus aquaticus]MDP8568613.1 hypothetical protein [Methylophilus aquaticus]
MQFKTVSRISFHGIEVPTSLFPDYWSTQKNQVSLEWPMPILLVVDICGSMDLDLNSSRTQILKGDKWFAFEAAFASEVFLSIMQAVESDYWVKLKVILLQLTENEIIINVLNNLVSEPA